LEDEVGHEVAVLAVAWHLFHDNESQYTAAAAALHWTHLTMTADGHIILLLFPVNNTQSLVEPHRAEPGGSRCSLTINVNAASTAQLGCGNM